MNITPANFYSNIPSVDDIEQSFEYRRPADGLYDAGMFDRDNMGDFIDQMAVYASEFDPPVEGDRDQPDGFFWKNPAFSFSDAMSYYCVLRHFKPSRVLEIGSGYSTFVANQALLRNGSGSLTLIEPYPMAFLSSLETVDRIIETFVQDIPLAEAVELIETSDVWFIDSTHTVKIGSDCLYIYLLLMPRVRKDLVVHSHDINLPFGMPARKAFEHRVYWTEQYLLFAYLLDNPKTELLFGSAYAKHELSERLDGLMQGRWPGGGGSLWYRLNGASGSV